jgi:hypothetical protein
MNCLFASANIIAKHFRITVSTVKELIICELRILNSLGDVFPIRDRRLRNKNEHLHQHDCLICCGNIKQLISKQSQSTTSPGSSMYTRSG